jgi:hypothetical protein
MADLALVLDCKVLEGITVQTTMVEALILEVVIVLK